MRDKIKLLWLVSLLSLIPLSPAWAEDPSPEDEAPDYDELVFAPPTRGGAHGNFASQNEFRADFNAKSAQKRLVKVEGCTTVTLEVKRSQHTVPLFVTVLRQYTENGQPVKQQGPKGYVVGSTGTVTLPLRPGTNLIALGVRDGTAHVEGSVRMAQSATCTP